MGRTDNEFQTRYQINFRFNIQGDHSAFSKPLVDIKMKVLFQYEALVLERNFCFGVNGRFDTT